jgi:hypothetical protein
MATAIVSGVLAGKPGNGGNAWARLSVVVGLRRLGFQVYFVEQIDHAGVENIAYFEAVMRQFDLTESAALVTSGECYGIAKRELDDIAAEAALLVNFGGHLTAPQLMRPARCKVYLDDDPGFTQLWEGSGTVGARLDGHDLYFTFGENIGQPECPIPTDGIDWHATRPAVVLDDWPVTGGDDRGVFTTVATWRGPYGPVSWNGHTFGLKLHEFRKFLELPRRTDQTFELALDIHADERSDLALLRDHGWRLADPSVVAGDPSAFRAYVQSSAAEYSNAQGIYVETGCGWFSDRTVRYMASGKPALVQDTGFSRNIPTGEGLIAFRTLDEAVAGVNAIVSDYQRHSRAARALAEEYFDSDLVLGRLIEQTSVAP